MVLGEGSTQRLDDTMVIAKAKYPINFITSGRRFVLSLHYNGSNSFLFVDAVKICQFKAKNWETPPYPLCLGNISKNFIIHNMNKSGLKGYVHAFSVDYNIVDFNDILDIHEYLIKIT